MPRIKLKIVPKFSLAMPPKKKGKPKKGNGNNVGDEERAESKPTEREILLSQQYVALFIYISSCYYKSLICVHNLSGLKVVALIFLYFNTK